MQLKRWIPTAPVLALLCLPLQTLAVHAYPFSVPIVDPLTGETIQGCLRGDEFFSCKVDAAEHVIAVDECGCLRYMILD